MIIGIFDITGGKLKKLVANCELWIIYYLCTIKFVIKDKNNKATMESSQDEMSFLDHLEALRWHLIRAIIAVLAVGVVAFVYKDYLQNVL